MSKLHANLRFLIDSKSDAYENVGIDRFIRSVTNRLDGLAKYDHRETRPTTEFEDVPTEPRLYAGRAITIIKACGALATHLRKITSDEELKTLLEGFEEWTDDISAQLERLIWMKLSSANKSDS